MDFKLDNLQVKSNKGTVIIPMIVNQQDTLKMPAVEIIGDANAQHLLPAQQITLATQNPLIVTRRNNIGSADHTLCLYNSISRVDEQLTTRCRTDVCGCNQAPVENGLFSRIG